MSWSLFPATEQQVRHYAWVEHQGFPLSKVDLPTAAAEHQMCLQERPTLSTPNTAPFSGVTSQCPGSSLTPDLFLRGKGNTLPLTEQKLTLAVDLPFLHRMFCQNHHHPWTIQYPSTTIVFHTALLLMKKPSSQSEVGQWIQVRGIYWFLPCFPPS